MDNSVYYDAFSKHIGHELTIAQGETDLFSVVTKCVTCGDIVLATFSPTARVVYNPATVRVPTFRTAYKQDVKGGKSKLKPVKEVKE